MTSAEKGQQAVHALGTLLRELRLMAYNHESHRRMGSLCDMAEYLVTLLEDTSDRTDDFRQCLVDIASRFDLQRLIDEFDQADVS